MWTPSNPQLLNAILDELVKEAKPTSYGTLWRSLQDRFGSKTTFNLYLRMLVRQNLVKREARRKLPDGRWITVSRGRFVRYSLTKSSPLSEDTPPNRIREWIEDNIRNSKVNLLTVTERCLKGEGDWEDILSEWEKTMRLNLRMWYSMRNKQGFNRAIEETLKNIDDEKRRLRLESR